MCAHKFLKLETGWRTLLEADQVHFRSVMAEGGRRGVGGGEGEKEEGKISGHKLHV
jgi:hypothetical protein